jgi:hypothetical protein
MKLFPKMHRDKYSFVSLRLGFRREKEGSATLFLFVAPRVMFMQIFCW